MDYRLIPRDAGPVKRLAWHCSSTFMRRIGHGHIRHLRNPLISELLTHLHYTLRGGGIISVNLSVAGPWEMTKHGSACVQTSLKSTC